jgi:transposase-like protein
MQPKSVPRRRHDAQLKAKVLAACKAPGASVSAVALSHGLNANLVRKWLHGRGLKRAAIEAPGLAEALVMAASTARPTASRSARVAPALLSAGASFVPIELGRSAPAGHAVNAVNAGQAGAATPAACSPGTIDIEVHRGAGRMAIRWPTSAVGDCAAWLRELTAGLLK